MPRATRKRRRRRKAEVRRVPFRLPSPPHKIAAAVKASSPGTDAADAARLPNNEHRRYV